MIRRLILAVALLAFTATPAHAATPAEHQPGDPGHGVVLPEDLDHPCAGRKLLYHSHNDALYGTRFDGQLAIGAVDGQQVTDQRDVCFRLPLDADADGNDVSRLTIPDDGSLDFLGAPGSQVWLAPQHADFTDNWRPIWSGIGAFDPAHELPGAVPSNFKDRLMYFDLLSIDGPGDVQIFFKNAASPAERLFNSADAQMHTVEYEVGAHGHFNWTFTKPGVYKLRWQGRAELTNGETEYTSWTDQYWLVGTDADVGLPEGTTTGLRTPNLSTPTPAPTQAPTPTPTPTPATTAAPAPAPAPASKHCDALRTRPDTFIASGHMDMGPVDTREAALIDDRDPNNPARRASGTFLFEVPDRARKDISATLRDTFPTRPEHMWMLPQSQQSDLPWLGFSTTHHPAPATVRINKVSGPGRMYTWHEGLQGAKLELDSGDSSRTLRYPANAHDHQAFGFTEPGLYAVTFAFDSVELVAVFAVGDAAIATAREQHANGYRDLDSCGVNAAASDTWVGALAKGIRSIDEELNKFGQKLRPTTAKATPSPSKPAAARTVISTVRATEAKTPSKQTASHKSASKPAQKPTTTSAPKRREAKATGAKPTSTRGAIPDAATPKGGGGIVSSFDQGAAQEEPATGVTASGFWGGLILGVGLMALLGGIALFVVAARMLRGVARMQEGV